MTPNKSEKNSTALILIVNLLLVGLIVAVFFRYTAGFRYKLQEQNIADITNINQASANISSSFFLNQQKRLADSVQYITQRSFEYDEALAYICDSNSDAESVYELIGPDNRGFAAIRLNGGFIPVDYTDKDYSSLTGMFQGGSGQSSGIQCTREFTDSYTANKSFALYSFVDLADSRGNVDTYTLLIVSKSENFAGLIALDGGYQDMSNVLVTSDGSYVFGSTDFKSDNLFKYFYDFNGLSLDEKNSIAEKFASSGSGEYYYKDSRGRDCVFVYTAVPNTKWFCVSCVPLSSFKNTGMDLGLSLWIAVLLTALMLFNVIWLNMANRRLKVSIRKEKEAGEAKTDFLSRMSHDIRTPLNVIIGTTILAGRQKNPPMTQKYLDDIDQSGKFLLSLVNDILDLNKVESGKMELRLMPYSYRQFHASMTAIIAPLCRNRDISFTMTGSEDTPPYMLDSTRLDQVFFNILSNSVKFTPPGGQIGLECSAESGEGGFDTLNFRAYDTGCGMSEEFQKHMFEAFTQEQDSDKNRGQGTGLGLAIVKNLIDLMDGTIEVDSAPGKGTVFNITIPAQKSQAANTDAKLAEAPAETVQGKCILLFEDNRINAEIAQTLLEDGGVTVEHASNGQEGLEMFSASAPGHYDAVLMDLRMPVMNGLDAARAIRALRRPDAGTVPIIAMTANAYDTDVQNCLDAGMNAHLSKPIDPENMFAVLAREISNAENHK
jgi:signal transduction histidine kinase/ActR/RegA family two-component response regulator